jgi:putative ABC transport system permease protein
VLLGVWGNDLLGARIVLGDLAGLRIPMDGAVLGYTLDLTVLTGLLFGVVPAWQASRPDLNEALKGGGRGASASRPRRRWRSVLVIAEVALALILLSSAGLFLRAMDRFLRLDPGFRPDHQLTMQLGLPEEKYTGAQERISGYRRVFEQLGALPGVEGVGAVTSLPILGTGPNGAFAIAGRPRPEPGNLPQAKWDMVNPQFFATLGLTVKQGRALTKADHENAPPVAVINETMARRFWPGESPVGQRFSRGDPDRNDWVEIVGVVSDVRYPGDYARSDVRPQIYESLWQRPRGGTAVVLRTKVRPESLVEAARQAVASIDPDLPIFDVVTFERAVKREMANYLLSAQLLAGFALLGLVLAGIGIYGVVSHSVAQRTNELGIRLALGAQPADLLRLVVRQTTGLVLVGVTAGLAGAFMVSLAIRGLLYGIGAFDPPTFGTALAVLAATALLACYLPARRAARVDPVVALRNE